MPESTSSVAAVIVAAGAGSRFGAQGPRKQYRPLLGEPLVTWSVRAFAEHRRVRDVVLVLPAEDVANPPEWLRSLPARLVRGGMRRGDSVRLGLDAVSADFEMVLVHDGARPLVTPELIDRVIDAAGDGAAIPGLQVTDTLKEAGADGLVLGTPDRRRFWRVQTPQAFPLETLRDVHRRALADGLSTTDDAALFEHYGIPVRIVPGDERNLKVTTPVDLALAGLLARGLPESEL